MSDDDALEIRADSIDEAELSDIWIAGKPLGNMVEQSTDRSLRIKREVGDRPEHVDDDVKLWALVDQLSAEVSRLQDKLTPDVDGKEYEQLDRSEKVHQIRVAAVEDAQSSSTRKAALTYREVKMLFGGKPSTGHCYDLMQLAGDADGFAYDERDEHPNRLTVDLGGVNDSAVLHAVNNAATGNGV